MIIRRITPEVVEHVSDNEVFVFGSNQSGRHGKGAAKLALTWGAKWGQAEGLQGRTYGIPTKNHSITRSLSPDEIRPYVERFMEFARKFPHHVFLVTEIGCGLAGHNPKDIAPLFRGAENIPNINLPRRFWRYLN